MDACSDPVRPTAPAGCRHLPTAGSPSGGEADAGGGRDFTCAEGLRALLVRLSGDGPADWVEDREAAALMRFAADRYAALARRHGQTPGDAAAAAFEVMQAPATRTAGDPWAVVTVAVRLTLSAEERAQGLLISARKARHGGYDTVHDVERFSDHAWDLADHHPALQHHDPTHAEEPDAPGGWVIEAATAVLVVAGCPPVTTGVLVEHVCDRLADLGSRERAYEAMRRDKAIRARFDLSHHGWITLLRATLGHPAQRGPLGHGILARLLAGETITDLTDDAALTALITVPRSAGDAGAV